MIMHRERKCAPVASFQVHSVRFTRSLLVAGLHLLHRHTVHHHNVPPGGRRPVRLGGLVLQERPLHSHMVRSVLAPCWQRVVTCTQTCPSTHFWISCLRTVRLFSFL
jgi:hypothetical protein